MARMKHIETEFINWLVMTYPHLNKDRIARKGPGENHPHVRFSSGCGINSEKEFLDFFKVFEYTPMHLNEFSKSYTIGGYIKWCNKKVGVLYGVAQDGQSERKRWSPESLGLNGFRTNDVDSFKSKILVGLKSINEPNIDLFLSLLKSVEENIPAAETEFLKVNKSKITSDFGEILAAFQDVVNGFEIQFSNKSNQKVIDYFVLVNSTWKEVSVKNPKGGGKVNLSDYVNLIDITSDNIHAKILHSIGSHNRDKLISLTSNVCPQISKIVNIIGGADKKARMLYVHNHSYDEFYNQIKTDPLFSLKTESLGIPNDQGWKPSELTPRSLWGRGSLDPLDFTINTLINRFWGHSNINEISNVVSKFLNKPKFKIVDIVNGNVTITECEFKDINKWKTVYWSRATKAWHNWMAVEPVKEEEK